MSAAAPALNPADRGARTGGLADWARGLLQKRLHILDRLTSKGMELARKLGGEVRERRDGKAGPAVDLSWIAAAFARVQRAIHIAILLQSRLRGELRQPAGKSAEAAAVEARAPAASTPAACGQELEGDLRIAARDERPELDRAEAFQRQMAADRAALARLCRYVMSRPVEELIQEICRDLGLGAEWLQQVEREWDEICERKTPQAPAGDAPPARPKPSSSASCQGPMIPAHGKSAPRPPDPPWIARGLGAYGSPPRGRRRLADGVWTGAFPPA